MANPQKVQVAIIGAGLSALSCTRNLLSKTKGQDLFQVTLFEKSRGPGGRIATRRINSPQDSSKVQFAFDHGAQYFTARDPIFISQVKEWTEQSIVKEWKGEVRVVDNGNVTNTLGNQERFVGVEGMSSIGRFMAKDFDIKPNIRIAKIIKEGDEHKHHTWTLESESGEKFSGFDWVLITCPSPQAVPLLQDVSPYLASKAQAAVIDPCWTLMVAFEKPLSLEYDGAFVHNSPISWIARNNSKPGRPESECWVVNGSPQWSKEHLEETPDQVEISC